ncbi:diguanylate cyclase (GGDEF) domain-containing protein [Marinobacter daqiaonensis]|uniref:Diguanylate cyclase (GGDEF) domain-containing protein n=1 Tax=Marinobacter daqiaonensis TaxID=650891 RepID=A0A1I6ID46_9GAMM|nr:GGDEF domain-containing protein [Marinobacter daqiaonensis]SFR64606.1 diguanylate cyclase (GGDEF) domain-containing protein [Marinobacter daqiaonensis]
MQAIRPFTLTFHDVEDERRYRQQTLSRLRLQGRMAILVGILVYLLVGMLDFWFVAEPHQEATWRVRIIALCVPVVVLVLTLTSSFHRFAQFYLSLVSVAAGVGLIAIQSYVPTSQAAFYYPAIILVTFYTYNFIGIRFIYALAIDLLFLVSYNLVFGVVQGYPLPILLGHDIFIVSANLIGGTAGYLTERQRRLLFLREEELDRERRYHFNRALRDPLTGLANRELLEDRISQAMATSQRENVAHCALFLDLDGFKRINDEYGHQAGDDVLKEVAERLQSVVRDMDTVARLGGDEFFVLLTNIDNEADSSAFADKLLERLKAPLKSVPANERLAASIGICQFPYPGMSVADIIHRADKAMYSVKDGAKGTFAHS